MSSFQDSAALLAQSLRTRRDILGRRSTGVTRESLNRLNEFSRATQFPVLRQSIYGKGRPDADLMFVGEAPGSDEEESYEPFTGPAGDLLAKIIGAMGLTREEVYIVSLPKAHSDPMAGFADDQQQVLPALRQQIASVRPRILIALGQTSLNALSGGGQPIGAMRGRWLAFEGIPLLTTYHPSYLLRNGSNAEKRKVWVDMLLVMEKIGLPITKQQRGFFRSAS